MRTAAIFGLGAALWALLACIYGADVWQGPGGPVVHLEDDNMITLRVAVNMAASGVPHFNPGEAVAANTSLFWPLMLAPAVWLVGAEALPLWLFHVSVALCVASALAVAGLVRHRATAAVLVAAVLLGPGMLKYGGSGWEHVPQMLAVTLSAAALLANRRRRFGTDALAFGAACLAFALRPDVAALVAGVWAIFAATHLRARPLATLGVSLAGLAVALAYVFLMLRYYGEVVPNTYHLKGAGLSEIERGLVYLATPRLSGWVPLAVLVTAAALWRRQAAGATPPRDRQLALVLLAQVASTALAGGDVFSAGRFFLCLLPAAFLLAVRAAERGAGRTGGVAAGAGLVLLGVVSGGGPAWQGPLWQRDSEAGLNRMAAHVALDALIAGRLTPADGSIGLHRLGQAYHLRDFHVVDFLGKAEPHIARTAPQVGPKGHNKWDYGHALATYDIAAAPFPMAEADLLAYAELPPHNWMYLWVFGRAMQAAGYRLLTPEELGLPSPYWGLFVRADLVERFAAAP